jgi:protein SCO1/2
MQSNAIQPARFALVLATMFLALQGAVAQEHEHRHDISMSGADNAEEIMSALSGIEIDFELLDRDGQLVRDEDFLGAHLLLGFGFTRCTDVCPLMALNMARVLQSIDQPAAGVFISVDTERDSPETVDAYTRNFDHRIVGLSGSVEQINTTIRNFNATYVVTKTEDGTTVQHTSHIYAIDPEGKLIDVFAFMTPMEEIAAALQ